MQTYTNNWKDKHLYDTVTLIFGVSVTPSKQHWITTPDIHKHSQDHHQIMAKSFIRLAK